MPITGVFAFHRYVVIVEDGDATTSISTDHEFPVKHVVFADTALNSLNIGDNGDIEFGYAEYRVWDNETGEDRVVHVHEQFHGGPGALFADKNVHSITTSVQGFSLNWIEAGVAWKILVFD